MQELDTPGARNEGFETKSTKEVVDITIVVLEHQSTKAEELTQGCSVSTATLAKAVEIKSPFCIFLGSLVLEWKCKKYKQKLNKPNGEKD